MRSRVLSANPGNLSVCQRCGRSPGLWLFALLLWLLGSDLAWADTWFDYRLGISDERLALIIQGSRTVSMQTHTVRANLAGCFITCRSRVEFDELYAVSYLVGKRRTTKASILTYQAGLGVVRGFDDEDCNRGATCREQWGIGVPLSVGLTFGKYVGFGAELFVNLNQLESTIGVAVGCTFGKFN